MRPIGFDPIRPGIGLADVERTVPVAGRRESGPPVTFGPMIRSSYEVTSAPRSASPTVESTAPA